MDHSKSTRVVYSVREVAKSISGRLAKEALVAQIDDRIREIDFAINSDSDLKIFTFNDEKGKETYWHSTSHLMAHAIK